MSPRDPQQLTDAVRRMLVRHGRLATDAMAMADTADLYQAGMTSHASVNIMLALEGEFDVEFPDYMLTRAVFSSIVSMRSAVEQLLAE